MRVFLSTDPLGYVDAFDRWLYVGGNPASYWDPFGLSARGVCDTDRTSRACEILTIGQRALGEEPDVPPEEFVTPVDEFMCGVAFGPVCDLNGGWVAAGDVAGGLLPSWGGLRDLAAAAVMDDPLEAAMMLLAAATGPAGDALRGVDAMRAAGRGSRAADAAPSPRSGDGSTTGAGDGRGGGLPGDGGGGGAGGGPPGDGGGGPIDPARAEPVSGYRAVSRAEADDIATHGYRPHPSGRSMESKWFSESREGAEWFRNNMPGLDDVVEARVPRSVYDRSYRHPNIDGTGPGFCVECSDLPLITSVPK